eukprot:TRINITY_DN16252_c1_g2_i1.p1 TRINITY_DN16252_c1_g2~~TRINITY_DN16252_c1_g2_i1.p1  ORF type:complete len:503 (-),score=35.71 TRINITY_DN16252_c1_g2_i1:342-1850(-)
MSPSEVNRTNSNIQQNICDEGQYVRDILRALGEDSNRQGLIDTPRRVSQAWSDLLSGYHHDNDPVNMIKSALFNIRDEVNHNKNNKNTNSCDCELGNSSSKNHICDCQDSDNFSSDRSDSSAIDIDSSGSCGSSSSIKDNEQSFKQMVVVKDVEFVSISSEDLWPVLGKCHVGYVPGTSGLVVGLSKIARVCRCLSSRITDQNQLAQQLISSLSKGLQPLGVAVMIEMQFTQIGGKISTELLASYSGCFLNRSEGFLDDFVTAMALHGIDTDSATQVPYKNGNGHYCNLQEPRIQSNLIRENTSYSTDEPRQLFQLSTLLSISKAVERLLKSTLPNNPQIPSSACIRYAQRLVQQCTQQHPMQYCKVVKLQSFVQEANSGLDGYGCRFSSMCEHHILPFYGNMWIVAKNAQNLNPSKCSEIVQQFSHRLQMQERLTQQICQGIGECEGVIIVCEAYHMCMLARGVQSRRSCTVTVTSQGCFDNDTSQRSRVLGIIRRDRSAF